MFEDDLLCKCGCGKRVSNKRRKEGGVYYNLLHANRHKGLLAMGKARGPYKKKKKEVVKTPKFESQKVYNLKMDINDRYYYDGCAVCKAYNDNDIKCVMCFEKEEYVGRSCRVRPSKIYNKES